MFEWMSRCSPALWHESSSVWGGCHNLKLSGAWFCCPPIHAYCLINVPLVQWRLCVCVWRPTIGRLIQESAHVWFVRRVTLCNKSSNTVGKSRILFAAAAASFLDYLQNGLNESVKTSPRMNWFLLIYKCTFSFVRNLEFSNVRHTVIIYWSWDIVFFDKRF